MSTELRKPRTKISVRAGGLTLAVKARNPMKLRALPLILATGCLGSSGDFGSTESASTVADYAGSGCSTSVVIGLSRQIAEEANCLNPGSMVEFPTTGNITATSNAVLPFLAKDARDDLVSASAGGSLQINSAMRTIAQQYLLYRWYQQGRCGITAAATVGHSNHEGGRAVDVSNYSSRITTLKNHGWAHDVPGDVVHFDHTSTADLRGRDTLAFQKLWNLNHPSDKIGEDGSYGPQTEARLKQAPATGFALGATCTNSSHTSTAVVASVQGPDRVAPGKTAHYTVTVRNTGDAAWPEGARLISADGQASVLYDATSWVSPTQITDMSGQVDAGTLATFDIDVVAPQATTELPVSQTLALADDTTTYATFAIALTVTGEGTDDSADSQDLEQEVTGGCNAGGGGSGALVMLGLALAIRGRGRARRAA